jgi:hypothetical protein
MQSYFTTYPGKYPGLSKPRRRRSLSPQIDVRNEQPELTLGMLNSEAVPYQVTSPHCVKNFMKEYPHYAATIFELLVMIGDHPEVAKLLIWKEPHNMILKCLYYGREGTLDTILKCGYKPSKEEMSQYKEMVRIGQIQKASRFEPVISRFY